MPLEIRPDHLKIVEGILKKHLPDREVWAFGSRVNGTAKETSDLDLVVIGENPLDFQTLGALRDDFSESNLPYKVDVVDWAKIGETFREIIRKEKVVIQRASWNQFPLGENNWKKRTWGEISSLEYGKALRGYELAQGTYRVYGTNGPIGWHSEAIFDKPSVIIGRKGAYRGVFYSREPFFVIDTAFYLKQKIEFDMRWAYYELLTHDINDMDTGSAIPSTSREAFYRLPILFPPLHEQRAIAHILGTLDDKIELNRRMNETLEAMAQALFKSWFVDFDPVRAKMEGRPTGLPKEIEDLFPDSFEDSELGEIPRGWEVSPFDQLITEVNEKVGGRHVSEYSSTNNGLQLRSERFKKNLSISISNNKIIRRGCLIFGLSRQVLNFGLMRNEIGCISPAYKVFSINETMVEPDFVERVMRLKPNYYFGAVSASSREGQSISAGGLKRLKLVLPSKSLQNIFYEITAPIQNHLLFLQKEAETLTQIRDFLLPKLLSGEIRVTHLEKYWSELFNKSHP